MRTDSPEILDLCERLALALKNRGWMMATAERCTGLSGSSDWFERGFVT